jgi:hypothetical protein
MLHAITRYDVVDNKTRENRFYVEYTEKDMKTLTLYRKEENIPIYTSSYKYVITYNTPGYSNHFFIAHLAESQYLVVKGNEAYIFYTEESDEMCRWECQHAIDLNKEYIATIGTKNMYFFNEHISVSLELIDSHRYENNVEYIVKLDKLAEANPKPLQMVMAWH